MTLPATQTAVVISAPGGPEVLIPSDRPVPRPGPGQLLIRVAAAGVNRHDVNQRAAGAHHDGTPVPGLEAAGHVVALGADVQGFAIGDPVMALLQGGGYAPYALAEAPLTLPAPPDLTLTEAAGVPEALFTAWWNFFGLMHLRPDEIGLIHGGTSGVGHLALQALSALGYRMIATAGSPEKVAAALNFGATAAFDYRDPELADQVLAATHGAGVNALLDMSAGAHIDADLAMMAPDGRIAHLSPGGSTALNIPLRRLMTQRISITGSMLRPLPLARKIPIAAQIRDQVLPLLGPRVRPVIRQIFPLTDAAGAHREMEKGGHIGKLILMPPG